MQRNDNQHTLNDDIVTIINHSRAILKKKPGPDELRKMLLELKQQLNASEQEKKPLFVDKTQRILEKVSEDLPAAELSKVKGGLLRNVEGFLIIRKLVEDFHNQNNKNQKRSYLRSHVHVVDTLRKIRKSVNNKFFDGLLSESQLTTLNRALPDYPDEKKTFDIPFRPAFAEIYDNSMKILETAYSKLTANKFEVGSYIENAKGMLASLAQPFFKRKQVGVQPYKLLGLDEGASKGEVVKAYQALSQQYDGPQDLTDRQIKEYRQLAEAYKDILGEYPKEFQRNDQSPGKKGPGNL